MTEKEKNVMPGTCKGMQTELTKPQSRRDFIRGILRNVFLAVLACFGGTVILRKVCLKADGADHGKACSGCPDLVRCKSPYSWLARPVSTRRTVWQLDPAKCIQCGRCATNCVLRISAVKCVHRFEMCGYCKLCFGFFQPGADTLTSAAENQMCPTGAIRRKFIEEPYYEYTIDESLCIGCGRCVKTCGAFGNGSLILQVRHDLCVNCNECSIARNCPAGAYRRVPADEPYLFKPASQNT
ncbi:MAG: 4Fe-4S binding protein [Kiritimatiellae bacterium]|nr:4Fe-4S binding protein [Kiritimatiellia bacterium]MDD5520590.1 4Fe-4S binding protein [Kiritimatiellia bacterium]